MTALQTQLEKYNAPHTYVERIGVNAGDFLQQLSETPSRPLSYEERGKFSELDSQLVRGTYERVFEVVTRDPEDDEGRIDVQNWYKKTNQPAVDFILDYFHTPPGQEALQSLESSFGVTPDEQEQSFVHTARRLASCAELVGGDKKRQNLMKKIAKDSHIARVEELKRCWLTGEAIPDDPEHLKLQLEPEKVIERTGVVLAMRRRLREARADLSLRADLSENVRDALLVEVDIFRQRATEILGELYPQYVEMYKQALLLEKTNTHRSTQLLEELEDVNRPLFNVAVELQQLEQEREEDDTDSSTDMDLRLRFALTMDKWRNGRIEGTHEPFSNELLELEQVIEALETAELDPAASATFTPEEIAYLDSLEFDADDIADMFKAFLLPNDLLSEHDDYTPGEWPADSSTEHPKIGIAVGEFENLAYDRGWLKIPITTKRKVRQTTPAGAALVVPHELEHAIDGISSEYGVRQVAATQAGTRLGEGVREGIGKRAENEASLYFFGQPLVPSLAYLKGLRTLLETQSETQAIMRFAEQAAAQEGNPDVSGYIRNAENRVQRLINYGGFSTRGLIYLEQELIRRQFDTFPDTVYRTVAANSYLDLQSQVRLHEFGLLTDERYQPRVSPIEAVEGYLRNILSQRETS